MLYVVGPTTSGTARRYWGELPGIDSPKKSTREPGLPSLLETATPGVYSGIRVLVNHIANDRPFFGFPKYTQPFLFFCARHLGSEEPGGAREGEEAADSSPDRKTLKIF